MSETELAALMAPYFDVDVVISDDRMYQVCGTKKIKESLPSSFPKRKMPPDTCPGALQNPDRSGF